MSIPILLAKFDGQLATRRRSGSVDATIAGSPRWVPGPYGNPALDIEPTVNACTNPGAEVNTTGWAGTTATIARITTDSTDGVACFEATRNNTVGTMQIYASTGNRPAASSGQVWTISCKAKGQIGRSLRLSVTPYTAAGGTGTALTTQNGAVIAATGGWQYLFMTVTMPATTASFVAVLFDTVNSGLVGDKILSDSWQFELNNHPTPFVNGTRVGYTTQRAIYLEEGTTNLAPNPVAAFNATDGITKNATGAGVTLNREVIGTDTWFDVVFDGLTGIQGFFEFFNLTGTGARTFTVSADVMGTPGAIVYVTALIVANGGAALRWGPSVPITLTGTPQRVSNTATSLAGDTNVSVRIQISPTYTAGSRTVPTASINLKTTKFQIEEKPYATSFAGGYFGGTYSWSGTPHNSSSVRANQTPAVNHTTFGLSSVQGSYAGRFYIPVGSIGGNAAGGAATYLWYAGAFSTLDLLAVQYIHQSASVELLFRTANAAAHSALTIAAARGVWHDIFVNWTSTQVQMQIDGGAIQTRSRTVAPVGSISGTALSFSIGSTQSMNGYEADQFFMDAPLTAAEIATLRSTTEPWQWETLFQRIGGLVKYDGDYHPSIMSASEPGPSLARYDSSPPGISRYNVPGASIARLEG